MKVNQTRLMSLDFMRALAIIFIIITHTAGYLKNDSAIQFFSPYFASFGVGVFIFISGYVLYLNNNSMSSRKDIVIFLKKRVIRIFPLYFLALIVFFVLYGIMIPIAAPSFVYTKEVMDFEFWNMVIHFLGLQIFLSPAYAIPILTLYYVGLIAVYYCIYPFLISISKNFRQLLLFASLIFGLFLSLRLAFNIIDNYFFKYYFVFISGIALCYIRSVDNKKIEKYLIFMPIVIAFSLILDVKSLQGTSLVSAPTNIIIISYFLFNVVVISFCIIELWASESFINYFSPKTKEYISLIAFSSYAIYLFHRPILTIWYGIAFFIGVSSIVRDLVIIILGIPSIIIISYIISVVEAKYFQKKVRPLFLK